MKYTFILFFYTVLGFAQNDSIRQQNMSVVSLELAHILYRGISNPIKIAVPDAKSFTATAPGLEKLDNLGNYLFNVTSLAGTEVTLSIVILLNDGSYKAEKQVFEIRDISRPFVVINGNCLVKDSTIGLTKQEFKLLELKLGFQNLEYTIKNVEPIYFNIIWPDKTYDGIKGNK
jgi:hypothetical protein